MSNLLYNPSPIKSPLGLRRDSPYRLPRNITDLLFSDGILYYSKQYQFGAIDGSGRETSVVIDTPLSLTPHGILSFTGHNSRYSFHHLKRRAKDWKQTTIILPEEENAPRHPECAHVASDGVYVLDQNHGLYLNRSPSLASRDSWQKIKTGLENLEATSSALGMLLYNRETFLFIRSGNWKKLNKLFPEKVTTFLRYDNSLIFLRETGAVSDEDGNLLAENIKSVATRGETLYLLKENGRELLSLPSSGAEKAIRLPECYSLLQQTAEGILLVQDSGDNIVIKERAVS